MRWTLLAVICALLLFVQGGEPEPYRINHDVIGESVADYLHFHPKCCNPEDESPPQPGQVQRLSPAGRPTRITGGQSVDSMFTAAPDTVFGTVQLKTMAADFLEKEGLIQIGYELKQEDYQQLKAHLLKEFGNPTQVSGLNGETLTWDNGVSRIDLQRDNVDGSASFFMMGQDAYLMDWLLRGLREQRELQKMREQSSVSE